VPLAPNSPQQSQPEPIGAVQSFTRGLDVLRTFSAERPRQTLAEVATNAGLARATARRFLHTLVAIGYAGTDNREFWLTPRVLELGFSYLSSQPLTSLAQPRLEELSRTINESSSLSVLDGTDIVYVTRVPVRRIMQVDITIGTRFPAHTTSMGRVLLAGMGPGELDDYFAHSGTLEALTPTTLVDESALRAEIDRVREQGWCLVDQELEPGLRSVAAPVTDYDGTVVAAVNISTQTAVHDVAEIHSRFLPAVIDAADHISADYALTASNGR
jgi:IclR family pca regulon transcriptional regulator